jgi:hypothetical protein
VYRQVIKLTSLVRTHIALLSDLYTVDLCHRSNLFSCPARIVLTARWRYLNSRFGNFDCPEFDVVQTMDYSLNHRSTRIAWSFFYGLNYEYVGMWYGCTGYVTWGFMRGSERKGSPCKWFLPKTSVHSSSVLILFAHQQKPKLLCTIPAAIQFFSGIGVSQLSTSGQKHYKMRRALSVTATKYNHYCMATLFYIIISTSTCIIGLGLDNQGYIPSLKKSFFKLYIQSIHSRSKPQDIEFVISYGIKLHM